MGFLTLSKSQAKEVMVRVVSGWFVAVATDEGLTAGGLPGSAAPRT